MRRRELLLAALAAGKRPPGPVVDTHIHLFDPDRFPYHPRATYRPPARKLEPYTEFVRRAAIDHAVIVHPEPYQDDHTSLDYFLAHEPRPGFFKATCLLDPTDPKTPARMKTLMEKHPGRIVGLRIHVNRKRGEPPTASGPIRDRDLRHPQVAETWRAAGSLGLFVQMHFIPVHAPDIGALAARFPETPVILDHLARAGEGTPAEYGEVLKLARLPRVYMKFSAIRYSSKEEHPYRDVKPLVRRTFDAFGADRIIWGAIGMSQDEFEKATEVFETHFDFAPDADRAKIRGRNALGLYGFRRA